MNCDICGRPFNDVLDHAKQCTHRIGGGRAVPIFAPPSWPHKASNHSLIGTVYFCQICGDRWHRT